MARATDIFKKLNLLSCRDAASLKISVSPYRDWRCLMTVWLIVVLLIFATTALIFAWGERWHPEPSLPSSATSEIAGVNVEWLKIERAMDLIEKRAERHQRLLLNPSLVIDPGR